MLPYRPAQRFKQGECLACAKVQPDMQKYLRPFFIIPPPKERDPEKGRPLTPDEIAYVSGERIGKHWPLYPAYLDAQYVLPAMGDAGLVRLFQVARARNKNLIAVAPACDIHNPIWRKLVQRETPRLAIHLPFEDFDPEALEEGLKSLGISAQDCEIFVDYTGSVDLGMESAAEAVAGGLEMVGAVAPWGGVVFQASNFPTTNPAEENGDYEVARHEWTIYKRLLTECSIPNDRLGFSDFGADCGKIAFPKKGGGGRPIPHVRYTTARSTVVVRGASTGQQSPNMTEVLNRLIDRPDFAGQAYSYADRRMWEAAKGIISPGNPSIWREWNMAHHMTRVLRDLGAMAGVEFENGPMTTIAEQASLFEEAERE